MSSAMDNARQKLPLRLLMQQHGDAVPDHKSHFKCPFCKGNASLRTHNGRQWFKCFSTSCPTSTAVNKAAFDEVRYLGWKANLRHDNGGDKRYSDAAIAYLKEAGEWKEERLAPSVMPGQKKRRAKMEPVAEKFSPPPAEAQAGKATTAERDSTTPMASEPVAGNGDVAHAPLGAAPEAEAENPFNETNGEGYVMIDGSAMPVNSQSFSINSESELDGASGVAHELEVKIGKLKAKGKDPAATEQQLKVVRESIEAYRNRQQRQPERQAERDREWDGYTCLRDFENQLTLSKEDDDRLFAKRGLPTPVNEALGFRSNPRTNLALLEAMPGKYPWEEIYAAGVWLPPENGRPRRPNKQFAGKGIVGRIKDGYKPKHGEFIDDNGNVWGWACNILIPYFNKEGELVSLRPHKGGGRAGTLCGTPRIYVPRRRGEKAAEFFSQVVITEGEFKAAALWAAIGGGRANGRPPLGVVAVPGISYVRHYGVTEQLVQWLLDVKARRVVVVYDNEDRSDKTTRFKQLEVITRARALATSMYRRTRCRGDVAVLPEAWRDAKGKADWDGWAASVVNSKG